MLISSLRIKNYRGLDVNVDIIEDTLFYGNPKIDLEEIRKREIIWN